MPCTRQAASSFRRIPLLLACVALLAAVAEGVLAPLVFRAAYASAVSASSSTLGEGRRLLAR